MALERARALRWRTDYPIARGEEAPVGQGADCAGMDDGGELKNECCYTGQPAICEAEKVGRPDDVLPCSNGYSLVGDSCYLLIRSPALWDTQAKECRLRGGRLAVPRDESTAISLGDFQRERGAAEGSVWIGVHDRVKNGDWQDMEPASVSYTRWSSNFPVSTDVSATEHGLDCVALDNLGNWKNDCCFERKLALCEAGTYIQDLPIGLETKLIPDSSLTASTEYDVNHGARLARLNLPNVPPLKGAWSARRNNLRQWIQVDLTSPCRIIAVATQGRYDANQWVAKYKVAYSLDGEKFNTVQDPSGVDLSFSGNFDRHTVVRNDLPAPLSCRYVRFRPTAWRGHISMRLEVYGQGSLAQAAPALKSLVCEHSALKLSCDAGESIVVLTASYGRSVGGSEACPHDSIRDLNCHASKSVGIVKEQCEGKNSCSVSASNSVFGDPCVGTYKYLEVTYYCV